MELCGHHLLFPILVDRARLHESNDLLEVWLAIHVSGIERSLHCLECRLVCCLVCYIQRYTGEVALPSQIRKIFVHEIARMLDRPSTIVAYLVVTHIYTAGERRAPSQVCASIHGL